MKIKNKSIAGYTIIELLAVVSILVVISGVVAGILYSTLRGSNKTKITTEISQNGSYALSIISGIIIDSRSVSQVDGIDISDCTASPSGASIVLDRYDGSSTTLSCETVGGVYTIASDSASLIDTEAVQVTQDTCSFSCNQPLSDPYAVPIVEVTFELTDKGAGLFESQGSATFNTGVSMRNYAP